jgi:hypothetical protein
MQQYLTRVELHNEQGDDYPKLHAQMEGRNFTRLVCLGNVVYHLPHATYLANSDGDRNFVHDLAAAAVAAIGRHAGIIVVQTGAEGVLGTGLISVR